MAIRVVGDKRYPTIDMLIGYDDHLMNFILLQEFVEEGGGLLERIRFGARDEGGLVDPVVTHRAIDQELREIGDEGVLALVCDSTNVFNENASGSEGDVRIGLDEVIKGATGRVLVTTFASNAARLQTLGKVARDTGRTLCVAGRSLNRILTVAKATFPFFLLLMGLLTLITVWPDIVLWLPRLMN